MDNSISLNKFISDTGYCSRREADKLIEAGRVLLNDEIAQTGNRYYPGDVVEVDGSYITETKKDKLVYIALNKPVGITTTTEEQIKGNIISFLNYPKRVFPIGRLDKDSEGLILLTNDGDIVNRVLRAENRHEKEYIVRVNKPITPEFLHKMSSGLPILGTRTKPCKVHMMGRQTFRIILTQGLNRQIRRMCEYLGYNVSSLQRIRIMHIKLDKLATGKWRYLSEAELNELQASLNNSIKTTHKKFPKQGSAGERGTSGIAETKTVRPKGDVRTGSPSSKGVVKTGSSSSKGEVIAGQSLAKKNLKTGDLKEKKAPGKPGHASANKGTNRKASTKKSTDKSTGSNFTREEKPVGKKNKSYKEYRKKGRGGRSVE